MKKTRKASIKTMSAAALIGAVMFGTPVIADEVYDPTPTLDKMHAQNPALPQSEYSLSEFTPEDVTNLPEGTVVKYELKDVVKYYDKTNMELIDADQRVDGGEYIEVKTKESIAHYYNMEVKNPHSPVTNAEGQNTNVIGDFINNSVAINNSTGDIKTIIGDFINNEKGILMEGRNTTSQSIGSISGDFIGNKDNSIYIYGSRFNSNDFDKSIDSIAGNFYNNKDSVINNIYGNIGKISGNFVGNSSKDYGAAIKINVGGSIESIQGNFINNTASAGGAIYNHNYHGYIKEIKGLFVNNTATNWIGGAIYSWASTGDDVKSNVENIEGVFINNTAEDGGGAIYLGSNKSNSIKGYFINNSTTSSGYDYYKGGGAILLNNGIKLAPVKECPFPSIVTSLPG